MNILRAALCALTTAACIFLLTAIFAASARGDETAAKVEPGAAENLSVQQQQVADRFKRLEDLLLRMGELSAAADPRRAALLKKTVEEAKKRELDLQFEGAVDLLEKDQLSRALENQSGLEQDLRALLELLLSEDRAKRLESEKARIRERLRRINEIIQQQKDVQARTGNGENMQRLSGEQRGIAEKTGKLAKEIGANEEQKTEGQGRGGEKGQKGGKGQGKGQGRGQGRENDQQQPPQPERPSDQDGNQTQKRLEDAQQRMEDAQKKLDDAKRRGAVEDQERAIQELERAKAALEEILRQLREEEIERMLAMLEARFRKMLQMEHEVHDGTVRLDSVPPPERTHNHEIESSRLSGKQSEIIVEVDKALLLLKEDGTAVALPAAVAQMREDMEQAAHRLGQGRVDRITQTIEEDVLAALQEIIDALKKAQKEQAKKPGRPGLAGQQGAPLIDLLAELKMIRALQLRVNRRTERYSKLIVGEQAEKADLLDALRRLGRQQRQIHQITRDLEMGKNQ